MDATSAAAEGATVEIASAVWTARTADEPGTVAAASAETAGTAAPAVTPAAATAGTGCKATPDAIKGTATAATVTAVPAAAIATATAVQAAAIATATAVQAAVTAATVVQAAATAATAASATATAATPHAAAAAETAATADGAAPTARATAASDRRATARALLRFSHPVPLLGAATLAGPTEAAGPLGKRFDRTFADHLFGQHTWEQAEAKMQEAAVAMALEAAGVEREGVDLVLAGDLLNQLGAASFAGRGVDLPLLGLYSACATAGEGLLLGATLCDAGLCRRVAVVVSSHHDAAERQFRLPTEFGNQRPPTAQWTATGAAAFILGEPGAGTRPRPLIVAATPGRVVDMGVKDPYDMGGAEAGAAADTIAAHLQASGHVSDWYDAIATGDLSLVGRPLCEDLLREGGTPAALTDCGERLYDRSRQDVHAGGSGAACCALVLAADLLPRVRAGEWKHLLFVATGALLSTTSYQQGESIPCIAHAVELAAPVAREEA